MVKKLLLKAPELQPHKMRYHLGFSTTSHLLFHDTSYGFSWYRLLRRKHFIVRFFMASLKRVLLSRQKSLRF